MTAKLGSVPAVVISTVRSSTNFTEGIERFQWLNSCTRIHKLYITFNTVYTVFASDKFLSTFLSKCICFSVVISPLKWMQKKKKVQVCKTWNVPVYYFWSVPVCPLWSGSVCQFWSVLFACGHLSEWLNTLLSPKERVGSIFAQWM